ncbi:MAG: hypothetical protein IJA94_01695 [Bacilli bacterium]|nr:hypothetical protein [Bacilli bacterium]
MSSNELNDILENSLIKYILIINEEKTNDELKGCGLHWLVNEYCETYSIPVECFYSCLVNIVRQYKEHNSDDEMFDEEIYAMTDAFNPLNFFNNATLYYNERKTMLSKQLEEVNNRFFECLQDVQIETERLENVKTSLEKSEIRSELAQANIALDKARKKESELIEQEKIMHEALNKLQEKIVLYYTEVNADRDDEETTKLSRINPVKPE